MNFLLHYIIDHQKGNNYFNTGLIIPDLAKGAVKSFIGEHIFSVKEHESIHQGALRHIQSDKLFHASAFFESNNQLFNQLIKDTPFSPALHRKWFIAHILFELMLDRIFVKYQPNLVNQFYDDLLSIDTQVLKSYLENMGASQSDRYMERFRHFREVQFIRYYIDNNKLLYSLNRIMIRVNLPELSETDGIIMLELINKIEKHYFAKPVQIELELKAIFK